MADDFTHWLEYLFLSADDKAWVEGFEMLLERWQLEDCRKLLTAAKRRVAEHPLWEQHIHTCEGRLWLHQGEWARADSAYRAALNSLESEGLEFFRITADLGLIARLRGDMKKAIHNHQLCLSLAAQHQWADAAAEAHIQLGLDYEITGDLHHAEQHLLEGERLYRELVDETQIALVRKSLALILLRQHQFERAQQLLMETLPVLEAEQELLHVAQAYGNLGNIAVQQGEYETARGYYVQALERFQELDAVLEICGVLNNLAGIAYYEGKLDEAQTYYEESLQRSRDLGSASDERNTLANLSLLYHMQNNYADAAQMCEDAIRISLRIRDRRMALKLLWRLLRLWVIMGLKRLT